MTLQTVKDELLEFGSPEFMAELKRRLADVKRDPSICLSEKDMDDYLRKHGVKIDVND